MGDLLREHDELLRGRDELQRAVNRAKAAREAEKPCETCDGTGAEAVTVLACCGNYRRTGECCGRPVPAQDVDPCPSCGGSGRTETTP